MVSFPSRNLRIVMVNSPPILNSPPIAPKGTHLLMMSVARSQPPLKPCREESGARAAANEVTMLDLTSSPPKKNANKANPSSPLSTYKGLDFSLDIGAATTAQIIKVLDYQKRHKLTLTATVKYFNNSPNHRDIPIWSQPKLTQWRKEEDEHRALLESGQGSIRRNNSVIHPNLEKALAIWFNQALEQSTTITTDVLRLKGQQTCRQTRVSEFPLCESRHNLRSYKFHGEGEKVDAKTLEEERKRVVDLTNKYDPSDIFNMDKTGLFYTMRPSTGLARNGRNGVKMNKTRITFAFTVNADGPERLPLSIIGSAAKPRSLNKKPASYHNHYYRSNKHAWMTGELYVEWLKARDLELRSKGRKVQLWLDNFSGHTRDVDSITNIGVHYFAPNMTSKIQPFDQGIIANFKAKYRRSFER
ncbi:BQ5605_C048g12370 [Microbotryum silenes-dioicae]|uniref:BQ5605_C048g12370 protein n=1 Tax=Microbotryum silenes-dioicae TaxID=796604 RepID=A0A2X0MSX1_9BASI|nr:BQ5605_C048g12370 [Microbotryum silenes-dioicae]